MDHDVLVAGEALIDFLPERSGPLSTVDGFVRRPGGAPANVAVGLARLDRAPLFWTRVGDDPFGRYLAETLAEEGIPERYVAFDPDAKTTLAFVTRDETGDRTFSFYRDGTADTRLEPGTIDDAVLQDLEWVHAGGVTLSSGRSREATRSLLSRAAACGCTVSFDPNARPELWESETEYRRVVRGALADVDVLKATRGELRALGFDGGTAAESARDAASAGPHTVFVTEGDEGAAVAATEESSRPGTAAHGGFDVDAVDATGAGDAFLAGAVVGLREGRGLAGTLEFANAVAAAATTGPGATGALPDRKRVRSILSGD